MYHTLARRLETSVRHPLFCALVVLGSSACDRELASPEPLYPGNIRNHVAPDLASSLTVEGRFTLPAPPSEAFPQITPERATEIAVAFARTFAPHIRGALEKDHGRPINFETLEVGSPAYYAATPYGPPPGDVHPGVRNAFGPYYIVYLVSPTGAGVLTVAVSAYTGAWVENGRLRLPTHHGGDVYVAAVREGQGFVMPVSPERAVQIVGTATGARVSSVPELLLPDRDYHPVHARWKITLDRSVSARMGGSGETRAVREVFVGIRGQIFLPREMQPQEHVVTDPSTGRTVRLAIRAGRPVAFVAATLSRQ